MLRHLVVVVALSVAAMPAIADEICTRKVAAYCTTTELFPLACYHQVCPGLRQNLREEEAAFKWQILDLHNKIRMQPLNGITASNMIRLKWSDELETLAVHEAHHVCLEQRIKASCQATPEFLGRIGSNVLALYANFRLTPDARTVMERWVNRKLQSDSAGLLLPYKGNAAARTFAPVFWAETKYIGCAYIQANSTGLQLLIVCKYSPGVQRGYNAFIPGKPGTNCPTGYTAGVDGLCT